MTKNKTKKEIICCSECGKNTAKFREFIGAFLCDACYKKLGIAKIKKIEDKAAEEKQKEQLACVRCGATPAIWSMQARAYLCKDCINKIREAVDNFLEKNEKN